MFTLLADVTPGGDPWPWICGILAIANAAQFYATAKERAQNRVDLLTVVPILADVKTAMADLREFMK